MNKNNIKIVLFCFVSLFNFHYSFNVIKIIIISQQKFFLIFYNDLDNEVLFLNMYCINIILFLIMKIYL
jgi:hypothetical protein